ncbi:LOW QUALITY PROTEIN: uncharacterized protein LOC108099086 [Drosophila ficusphila]|uniref:LOW QUALITY PROTEIN: uncharacterized protein LOC108099086 n=1 Tax=Drosophila ficusphila TaxID=30025 RepID=UPI001C8AD085|nr:LOW QUALITY PROTEIN: uncharacterized protein LOC108099086 [Drosophila ficusphila]
MRLSNLFWIVQLSVIICAIGIEGQPGGMRSRKKISPSVGGGVEASADENMERRRMRSDAEGLLEIDPLASGLGSPASDQNAMNTCQMVPNLAGQTLAAPSSVSGLGSGSGSGSPVVGYCQPNWQLQQSSPLNRITQGTPSAYSEQDETEQRRQELRNLVQHLYVAQARVQLEATEIRKAQAVASSAQAQLEESANQVRSITASLHTAQQEVAASAIRAQIAQLQLAAHDQLLFAARQDVDALSSQMVGLQAAEGIVQPRLTVDLHALLEKLKQPLQQYDRPTPVPAIAPSLPGTAAHQQMLLMQQPQLGQGQAQGQGQGQGPSQGNANPTSGAGPSDFISLPSGNPLTNLEYT